DSREHRGIVFVTNGELGQGAFRNYGLQELAALLRNNHIRFYVVYVTRGARDDALEYLSSASGGDSMFLYRDDGISGIVDELADHPSGRYTLRVSSGSDTDFGRAYIPLEVEAYLIRRSGRDEAGYFGPREF
ncbi:MAG: 6-bladed beta-propeller, partial [Spirochaetaceae bacterium]